MDRDSQRATKLAVHPHRIGCLFVTNACLVGVVVQIVCDVSDQRQLIVVDADIDVPSQPVRPIVVHVDIAPPVLRILVQAGFGQNRGRHSGGRSHGKSRDEGEEGEEEGSKKSD